MNEKVKGFFAANRVWLIFCAILFVWGVCGTISAVYYRGEYRSIAAIIEAAGGDEFVELVQQHTDTAIGVYNDIVSTRIDLQIAVKRAAELERRFDRAIEYVKSTDGELTIFRSTMDGVRTSITDIIRFQQGIIDFVGRIQANNNAIKAELGECP